MEYGGANVLKYKQIMLRLSGSLGKWHPELAGRIALSIQSHIWTEKKNLTYLGSLKILWCKLTITRFSSIIEKLRENRVWSYSFLIWTDWFHPTNACCWLSSHQFFFRGHLKSFWFLKNFISLALLFSILSLCINYILWLLTGYDTS